MKEYLNLVSQVLENGTKKTNRTGTDTLMVFGYHYKINLQDGFPLITTKKVYFSSVIRELLWYLSGETHIRNLESIQKYGMPGHQKKRTGKWVKCMAING